MEEEQRAGKLLLHLDMGDILDQDQLDMLTRQLQNEMLDQGLEVGLLREDELPEGTKAAEAITWGALAVEVLPAFIPSLVGFLQSWTMRGESRKVKVRSQVGDKSIELEYSPAGVSNEQIKELVTVLTDAMGGEAGESGAEEASEEEGS